MSILLPPIFILVLHPFDINILNNIRVNLCLNVVLLYEWYSLQKIDYENCAITGGLGF